MTNLESAKKLYAYYILHQLDIKALELRIGPHLVKTVRAQFDKRVQKEMRALEV